MAAVEDEPQREVAAAGGGGRREEAAPLLGCSGAVAHVPSPMPMRRKPTTGGAR